MVVLSTNSCTLPLPDVETTQNETVQVWARSKIPGGALVVVEATVGCVLPMLKRAPVRLTAPSTIVIALPPPSA